METSRRNIIIGLIGVVVLIVIVIAFAVWKFVQNAEVSEVKQPVLTGQGESNVNSIEDEKIQQQLKQLEEMRSKQEQTRPVTAEDANTQLTQLEEARKQQAAEPVTEEQAKDQLKQLEALRE